jgi:5-methylcytosine-specific restriction protein A
VNSFLLTWNPTKWEWDDDDYNSVVEDTEQGIRVPGRWSVGNTRHAIHPGHRAYLVRQHNDRGLIGTGHFTSRPFEAGHFTDPDDSAWYAYLDWERLVDADDRIPLDELIDRVPEVSWNALLSSGTSVPAAAVDRLESICVEHWGPGSFASPEEVATGISYEEGHATTAVVNRYERDPKVRAACIAAWGDGCSVCGLQFQVRYGERGAGFIHVHHLNPLATIGSAHEVDPVADLRPVCPNCHAMLHRGDSLLTVEELKKILADSQI